MLLKSDSVQGKVESLYKVASRFSFLGRCIMYRRLVEFLCAKNLGRESSSDKLPEVIYFLCGGKATPILVWETLLLNNPPDNDEFRSKLFTDPLQDLLIFQPKIFLNYYNKGFN